MILIRSVKVVDGTGKPAYTADVLVNGENIAAIGYFPNKKTEVVIDGLGFYLTPGFIDIHADIDHSLSLFTEPDQKQFLLQGVTTVIGGNCGSSLAPLLYGTLESIQKWTDTNQINVNWQTMGEFLQVLDKRRMGINFGTLIGHSTIRRSLVGDQFRDLTEKELNIFSQIVAQALQEGALGFSSGLSYAHAKQAPSRELEFLASTVNKANGVYATHLRNEREGLIEAVQETMRLAERTGVKTVISHFRPIVGFEEQFQKSLLLLEKSPANIWFDIYPFEESTIPIYTLLPAWAQNGGLAVMLEHLLDVHCCDRILKELPPLKKDDLLIIRAPGNEFLIGKTLGEFAKNQGLTLPEALIRLMIATRLKALILYKNINQSLVIGLLSHPKALISSNTAKITTPAFPKFLELATSNTNALSIETAVQKITNVPAKLFRIKQRGVIEEGGVADLVLLKDTTVDSVFINGQLVVRNGEYQGLLSGQVIKP